jgi:hypothetical protein
MQGRRRERSQIKDVVFIVVMFQLECLYLSLLPLHYPDSRFWKLERALMAVMLAIDACLYVLQDQVDIKIFHI